MSGRKTIAIVHGGSFCGYPLGGIETFLATVIPRLNSAFDLKLIGMGMDESESLGVWTEVEVQGRSYPFLPVLPRNRITWIPDRIQLMIAIARFADEVIACNADAYYVHMTEAAISLLSMTRRPIVVHVHGLYNLFEFSRYSLGPAYARVYEHCYPALFSRCAKVIGVGSKDEFTSFTRAMKVRSGAPIPTCVRTNVFFPGSRSEARAKLAISGQDRIVLFVGRMTPTKNPQLLVDVVRRLGNEIPNLKAVFIGDGPERPAIQSVAEQNRRVLVMGRLDSDRVATWMSAADVLAVVSKTEAFTSIAALEALSCGTPVVATPVSALPDTIREGVNGAVAIDFSVEAYADALRRVLAFPPDSSSCAASVRDYSPEAVAQQITTEIQAAIAAGEGCRVPADTVF